MFALAGVAQERGVPSARGAELPSPGTGGGGERRSLDPKHAFVISNLIFAIPRCNKWLLPLCTPSKPCSKRGFDPALTRGGMRGGNCRFKAVAGGY